MTLVTAALLWGADWPSEPVLTALVALVALAVLMNGNELLLSSFLGTGTLGTMDPPLRSIIGASPGSAFKSMKSRERSHGSGPGPGPGEIFGTGTGARGTGVTGMGAFFMGG